MLQLLNISLVVITINTPGTAGGPGGRDRTLAVKSFKKSLNKNYLKKIFFFGMYLLVMPKYWGDNYFAHGRFPEVGQKQKTERERERKKKKRTMVITMASYALQTTPRVVHAKHPGPKQWS